MTTRHALNEEMTEHLEETVSRITDKVIEEMNDWSVRPLDEIYAIRTRGRRHRPSRPVLAKTAQQPVSRRRHTPEGGTAHIVHLTADGVVRAPSCTF
jgi:hypothetical protein